MKKTKQIIPIFFAADNNYVPFLSVAISSLKAHASSDNDYHIHIMTTGFSEESKTLLGKYAGANFALHFINLEDKLAEIKLDLPTRDYYTKAIYFRLFIPGMFPQYDKALYLDGDIALNDDIAKLFNYDLGDNYLGAIPDQAVAATPEFIEYVENCLGVEHRQYFNSGVLVMNLKRLRNERFEEKFIHLLPQYTFIAAPDQDYLNVLCKGRVLYIPPIWNKMPIPFPPLPLEDVKLVHYNLSFKPWHYDNIMYDELFWKYARRTEFYEQIMQQKNSFSTEDAQKDIEVTVNLKKLAHDMSLGQNTFRALLGAGKIKLLTEN